MGKCLHCDAPVEFVARWRGDAPPVACEVEFAPDAYYRESFVEVARGEFVSVFRHHCSPAPIKEPDKYKPIHWNYKGRKKKCPSNISTSLTTPASLAENGKQLELDMGIPKQPSSGAPTISRMSSSPAPTRSR
jgi:hypothetical protein